MLILMLFLLSLSEIKLSEMFAKSNDKTHKTTKGEDIEGSKAISSLILLNNLSI